MIPANELRIGNWVNIDISSKCGKDFITEKISFVMDSQVGGQYRRRFGVPKYQLKDIYPIQLTPEILEKCGFVTHGHSNHISLLQDILPNTDIEFKRKSVNSEDEVTINYNDHIMEGECANIPIKCDYLHQLQNLIFALTGEELEINL